MKRPPKQLTGHVYRRQRGPRLKQHLWVIVCIAGVVAALGYIVLGLR